jgi:hypothetical protein
MQRDSFIRERSAKHYKPLRLRSHSAAMLKPINVRLPERILRWIDEQAGDTASRSQVIRSVLDDAISRANAQPTARAPLAKRRAGHP